MSKVVYRVVHHDPPTEEDFKSHIALGKVKPPTNREKLHMFQGISVQGTLDGARSLQKAFPKLGQFIAELSIPDEAPLSLEPELEGPGHYNIYDDCGNEASPAEIVCCVTATIPAGSTRAR
jgi:hypothetical protein